MARNLCKVFNYPAPTEYEYHYPAVNIQFKSTPIDNITVTNRKETDQNKWTIAPNPNQGIFDIAIKDFSEDASYIVSSIEGVIITEGEIISRSTRVDLSPFPKGVYFVRFISHKNDMKVKRVLVL